MMRMFIGLYGLYAQRHCRIELGTMMLHDADLAPVGFVDRIALENGAIHVSGWTSLDQIGLTGPACRQARRPWVPRADVQRRLGAAAPPRPGFEFAHPGVHGPLVLQARADGQTLIWPLPEPDAAQLRRARRATIPPFLAACLRQLPDGLRWLLRRDPQAGARLKRGFGLTPPQPRTGLPPDLIGARMTQPVAGPETAITIILPVFNGRTLLPEVLDRIVAHTDLPWHLILIDDASTDPGLRPWLRSWYATLTETCRARVSLLHNDRNLGFIGTVNRGLELAQMRGCHVVLLNSDAFVPEGWASRLLAPIVADPQVASVTPMSNDAEIFTAPEICSRIDLRPGEGDDIDAVARRLSPTRILADAPTGVGFCMAIGSTWLQRLGRLDPAFGRGYGEEVDWCRRIRKMGGRHLGHAGIFVEHRGGASFGSEEKRRLIARNNQLISKRYPGFDQEVQAFIQADPLQPARFALSLALVAARQNGSVPIYLAHSLGGGAEDDLQRRIAEDLTHDAAALVIRVGGRTAWQLEIHRASDEGPRVQRTLIEDTELLERLISLVPSRRLVYSCGVGAQDPLEIPVLMRRLARRRADRLEVLFHDYFPISPSYTLLDENGLYDPARVGDPGQDAAHSWRMADGQIMHGAEWRRHWMEMLRAADQLVVFSHDSRAILSRALPELAARIVLRPHRPHPDLPLLSRPQERARGGTGTGAPGPVIGVLGNIGYQKGAAIVQQLSRDMARAGQGRVVVLGRIDPHYALAAPSVVHGGYRLDEIAELTRRYRIEAWLMPSIWPETFSFTIHEALATGLPVWCFDIGNQADAVRAHRAAGGAGGVLPLPAQRDARIFDSLMVRPERKIA